MVMENQGRSEQPAEQPVQGRGTTFQVAALLLVAGGLAAIASFFMASPQANEPQQEGAPPRAGAAVPAQPRAPEPGADRLFRGWQKPDVALILSGQEHGYLQPCGCSRPQLGGLARRFNFVQQLRERGWPVVAVDLGDVPQRSGPQALLKYKKSMEALELIGYTAVGIGEYEMGMPLFEALGEWALNNPRPRVLSSNLKDRETNFPGMVANWELAGGKDGLPRVGVVGVVAQSVQKQGALQQVEFDPADKALRKAVQEVEAKQPELLVLLFQGTTEEARVCARLFPQFRVILCLSREEEPAGRPERVGDTAIVSVGHKGRYVGVVGAWRTGKPDHPWKLDYELVAMSEDYETPEGQEASNPIHGLLDRYAREVRDNKYLDRFARMKTKHPVQISFPEARYVGSDKCESCHEHAYKVWKQEIWNPWMQRNESHAHAYQDLVEAKRPSLRQHDGECVACHVVGFDYQTGFVNETQTAHLKDVGCESCHGPGSLHRNGNNDPKLLALMNPYKPKANETPEEEKQRMIRLDAFCQKCHDQDNDVHWTIEKWKKIIHREPVAAAK